MREEKKKEIYINKIFPEYGRVFNFVFSRVRKDKELAQDLTQATMEMAWYKMEQVRGENAYKAWVMQIAMNEVNKYFRAQNAKKRSLFIEEPCDITEMENIGSTENIEDVVLGEVIRRDDSRQIMQALDKLKEQHRILIELRLVYNFKFAEIATVLEIKEVTTRVNYIRALKRLREEYLLVAGKEEGRE